MNDNVARVFRVVSRLFCRQNQLALTTFARHVAAFRGSPFGAPPLSLKSDKNEERGYPNHLVFLLFTGANPLEPIMKVIGDELPDPRRPNVGKTIRGAYGHHRLAHHWHGSNGAVQQGFRSIFGRSRITTFYVQGASLPQSPAT